MSRLESTQSDKRRRYHYLRMMAELRGERIADVHRLFVGKYGPIDKAFFYQVARGFKRSARVESYLNSYLKESFYP